MYNISRLSPDKSHTKGQYIFLKGTLGTQPIYTRAKHQRESTNFFLFLYLEILQSLDRVAQVFLIYKKSKYFTNVNSYCAKL